MIVPLALTTTDPLAALMAVMLSVSPSESLSLARIARVIGVSSGVVAKSLAAVGTGLVMLQLKFCVTLPPLPSDAVTETAYVPARLALLSIVPEMTPVAGSMLRPGGRPVALKLSGSLSTSEKLLPSGTDTIAASAFTCGASAVATGASLSGVMVTVTVAVDVPPLPSLIV